jgi:hypothetical protein
MVCMLKLQKLEEFIITETGVKVTILVDVKTMGREYAEAHLKWPKISIGA